MDLINSICSSSNRLGFEHIKKFDEQIGYLILTRIWASRQYMRRISNNIKGSKIHGVQMIKNMMGHELMKAEAFHKNIC